MYAVATFLVVAVITVAFTKLATGALIATGVPPEAAAFQARSAFSGAGFTTTEAENVVNQPVRRRIIGTTMLVGSLGTPTLSPEVAFSTGILNCHDADTTVERYLHVIHCKTAKLFEAAARLGAILAQRPEKEEQALADYGKHLGTAFQLIDDTLDYSATSEQMGKNIGDDLAEGKPTLPLLYAMSHGNPVQQQIIRQAIENGGIEQLQQVLEAIESTGALDYTAQTAQREADKAIAAIQPLPASPYKEALIGLAHFAVHRSY